MAKLGCAVPLVGEPAELAGCDGAVRFDFGAVAARFKLPDERDELAALD